MKEEYKPGDRVVSDFLGAGKLVATHDVLLSIGVVMVLFDHEPPRAYNMGQNPTPMFTRDLRLSTAPSGLDDE